nr:PREDICTED: uncharacterized protein LOC109038075 [Bemisia tabaci]
MWRHRRMGTPPTPDDFKELDQYIKLNLKRYGLVDKKKVYVGLEGTGRHSCIVYANRMLLNEKVPDEVHIDGTFKARPAKPASAQLFTILGMYHGVAIPIAFALMRGRKKQAYANVFESLKREFPCFEPSVFVSDFERAMHSAIKFSFPSAKHFGCFFHFAQADLEILPLLSYRYCLIQTFSPSLFPPTLSAAEDV